MQLQSVYSSGSPPFIVTATPQEYRLIQDAGFRWHGDAHPEFFDKCEACQMKIPFLTFWTDSKEKAARLFSHADSKTKAALITTVSSMAESRALAPTTALDVPAPPGLTYMPFQLAGVEYMLKRFVPQTFTTKGGVAPSLGGVLLADEMG